MSKKGRLGPRKKLLSWFERYQRDLPWRRTRDPYPIWVSEIMLQQTRVETVIPYFERFMNRFPTVESLAEAEVEEVLGMWAGLGYYRRARLLHQTAERLTRTGGRLPANRADLEKLPGIGAYTAAAIGSIAFGLVEPAIDGNVERVISRYLRIGGDPKKGDVRKKIAAAARSLIDEQQPGASNQALMELGATLCTPRDPRCSDCPLAATCLGLSAGDAGAFPTDRSKVVPVRVRRRVAVVRNREKVLLLRRPENSDLLAGFWELPWVETEDGVETGVQFAERYGGDWYLRGSLGTVRHSITHRRFEVEVLEGRIEMGEEVAAGREAGWFTDKDLENLAVSSLVKKALRVAAEGSSALAGRKQVPTQ